jgi:uncharacterized protein YndB with AHSA1/START domain
VTIQTCPTEVIRASPERIWQLLIDPRALARWSGTRLVDSDARTFAPGDRVAFRAFPGFELVIEVGAIRPPAELHLDVRLPFGVLNREVVSITPSSGGGARVTYT